jgi:cold shock CspA family protein
MTNEVHYGTVRMYDELKGFGFLRHNTGKGKDVFFFYDDLKFDDKDVCVGDVLSFSIEMMEKGPRARNIEKVS